MSTARLALIFLALPAGGVLALGEPDEHPAVDDVPVVGRPSDLPFSGASGWFEARAGADPTTVEAETALTFTLTVRAVRATQRPPQRIDLRQLPDFENRFYIEDSSEEPHRPDDRTWEFIYRLKPRRADVTAIPSLPFVYFNSYLLTTSKGFQVIYTEPIPLRVLPHESVQVPLQATENTFTLATGPGLLERQTTWTPGIGTILALLLTPPAVCILWFSCWQRLYPDAARLASQRRSRAARQALAMLHASRRLDEAARAGRIAAIVSDYLRERLDLMIAEPTPREIVALFAQRSLSEAATARAAHFLAACDNARFLPPDDAEATNLPELATRLILAVEEETCPTPPS